MLERLQAFSMKELTLLLLLVAGCCVPGHDGDDGRHIPGRLLRLYAQGETQQL
jgi:hypothetical protein